MTRTVFVDTVSDEIKEVYDLVLENQKIALDEMGEGATIKIVSRIVEGNFKMHGHDFMHALGHGIGLNVHEEPIIFSKSDKSLRENMVVAIEPRCVCNW